MRKLYLLISLLTLLAAGHGASYAQTNYFPGNVTISAPANYCVGTAAAPLTGTVAMGSCTGVFTSMSLTCKWYYNITNTTLITSATLVSVAPAFASTTAAGTSVIVPPYTPSTTTAGVYYYFCVIEYPPSVCNIDSVFLASNTNAINVGAPGFTLATLTPNPICSGDFVSFNASAEGATSYQWFGPGTSGFATGAAPPPFSVNVADAGVYTITATNACGTSSANVTLTVNTPITAATASATSPLTFCAGGSLTLTATVTGGTGVTYGWTGPNAFSSALLNPAPFTATGLASGIYTFTATPDGCPAVVITTPYIEVDEPIVLSTINADPNPVCATHLINLSVVELYGTQFLWVGPNGYTSTQQTPTPFPATPLATGVYTLTISNTCNTITGVSDTLVVVQMPELITGSDTNVCAQPGVIAQFADLTIGGIWYSSDTLVAKVNTVGGVSGVGSGTAVIYYALATGCFDSVTVHVGRPPAPIIGKATICKGDSVQFTDPISGGIWTTSNGNASINHNDGYVTGMNSGATLVMYTTPGCPPDTFHVYVSPAPLPIVGQLKICLGATSSITDNSGNGTWSVSNPAISPLSATTATSAVLTGLSLGVDTVYYRLDSSGCRVYAAVTVEDLPAITVSGPNQICFGECATLTVTKVTAGTYRWDNGTGISCTNCDSVLACPLETQIYTVTVTNDAHCVSTTTHLLQVNPLPHVKYTPDPFYMCLGTPKQITAFDTIAANAPDTYFWRPNVYIDNINIPNPTFSDPIDLVYTVVATSQFGCKDSVRVPVSVLDPAVTSISPDTIICIGDTHHMIATCTDPTAEFHWYIFNGSGLVPATSLDNDSTAAVNATPTATTTYACVITENACFTDTKYVTVFVDPLPALAIAQPKTIIAGSSITLSVQITNGDTGLVYEWTPAETVTCPSCPSTSVTPDSNTEYHVCVTTNRGCVSCDSVKVNMFCDKAQIFIPNTFTPNGDGFNDRFMVSGQGLGLISHMSVYNRWGEVVYDQSYVPANDATYGWDGTYKGQVLEPDVFMYVVEIKCETQGVSFKLHGDISLVR